MKKLKWILIDRSVTPSRISEHEQFEVAMSAYREYIKRLDDVRDIAYIDVKSEIYEEKE